MRGHFDDVMAEKRSKKRVRIRCSMLKKHTIKILKKQKTVTGNHSFSRNKYVKKGNEKNVSRIEKKSRRRWESFFLQLRV